MRTKPLLWKKIIKKVKNSSKGGRKGTWSARKAQLAVKLYKKQGGDYKGKKSKKNSLIKWTNQKWRTKSGKPSLKTGERYLPEKAIKKLTDKEYKQTSKIKRKDTLKGKVYSKQPERIAKKVKFYRKFGKTNEKLLKIEVSNAKNKKYTAFVYNSGTKKIRKIHFGDKRYEQYKDSTNIKKYKNKDHKDKKRRRLYFLRHSGVKTKKEALKKEKKGKYTAKVLSHIYLW